MGYRIHLQGRKEGRQEIRKEERKGEWMGGMKREKRKGRR